MGLEMVTYDISIGMGQGFASPISVIPVQKISKQIKIFITGRRNSLGTRNKEV
jgi:hypothetical protein